VPLGSLGPRFWTPPRAPDWTLPRSDGKPVALASYRGKPVIVIFYLGYGCVHCLEQLAAFAPAAKQFAAAGISLVAVSTDAVAGLAQTVDTATRAELPFPIVSDQSLATFKKYRAFDGFENIPLHGTFLIDGQGLIRWHDVSYEPFKDVGALLAEAKRLLRVKVRAPDKAVAPAKELAAR
jgi:peroxiredoxin